MIIISDYYKSYIIYKDKNNIIFKEINYKLNNSYFDFTLPTYNYCGPGTRYNKNIKLKKKPISLLDEICLKHDYNYENAKNINDINIADYIFINEIKKKYKNFNIKDKIISKICINIIKLKLTFYN